MESNVTKIAYSLLIIGLGIILVRYGKFIKGYFKGQFLGVGYISIVAGIIYLIIGLLKLFPSSATNMRQTSTKAAPVIIYTAPSLDSQNRVKVDSIMRHDIDSISSK